MQSLVIHSHVCLIKKCNSKTFLERLVSQIDVLFWKLCTSYGLYESKPQAKNASNLDAFACHTLISVDKRFIEPCLHVEVNSVIKNGGALFHFSCIYLI